LNECFRCSPHILTTALELVEGYPTNQRISKTAFSFCKDFTPKLNGIIHRWIFKSENAEYMAIAESCKSLIDRGMKPRNILILISNRDALLPGSTPILQEIFNDAGIPIEMPTIKRYVDTEAGRLAYALLRIGCDINLADYVAHRTVLGLLKGVGYKVCNSIRVKVNDNNLNYLDIFYNSLPNGIFSSREINAINKLKIVCEKLENWQPEESLDNCTAIIASLIKESFGDEEAQKWLKEVANLPEKMNINELRMYLSTDNSDQQEKILEAVYQRLNLPIPQQGIIPQQVRVMTMHGAKGLNADVVFIPGLEEDILPGEKRARYPGLVEEAARQLYVSITRARVACFVSYARSRFRNGIREYNRPASRYCPNLKGKFQDREKGLEDFEADEILNSAGLFRKHQKTRTAQLS
jgi:superfamily I DNA/RNA helicase